MRSASAAEYSISKRMEMYLRSGRNILGCI